MIVEKPNPMTATERRLGLGLAMSLLDTCGPVHDPAYRQAVADLRRALKARVTKSPPTRKPPRRTALTTED